jgi:two-component system, NarL family, nitrate/nitrite response regulator NarL
MGSLDLNSTWHAAFQAGGVSSGTRRGRFVLVESQGLMRDSLAHLVSTSIRDAVVQSYGRVGDVVPGPARLLLIGVDPRRQGDADSAPEKLRALQEVCGQAPIAVVLACDDPALMRAFRALGVVGVLRRDVSLAVAVAAIQLMWVGGSYLPSEFLCAEDSLSARPASVVLEGSLTQTLAPQFTPIAHEPSRKESESELALTSRECDVLRVLREGRQNKIIAFELGISESTVKVHLRNIMKKLHASNRTQVALGAVSAPGP